MADLTPEQLKAAGIQQFDDGSQLQTFDDGSVLAIGTDGSTSALDTEGRKVGLPDPNAGAKGSKVNVTWSGKLARDLRVRLEVPPEYLDGLGGGPNPGNGNRPLKRSGGIIFPYTPTVSVANQAAYSTQNVTHSLWGQYFYKNSVSGPISVSGKLTAQNEYEAAVILGIQHLLRALTKMRWGSDTNAGAPPPVCRFHAFGNAMLQNVPVVISSWKLEYPDSVDYIQVGPGITDYGNSFVPTVCTLTLEMNVVYSRAEQLEYSVDEFLNGKNTGKGYI